MRLLNTRTQELKSFHGRDAPEYAILSHTWGEDEVLFEDVKSIKDNAKKQGWTKVNAACAQAVEEGLEYIWIDTCCIDKSSSSELSEAINSMFRYYQNATICYAHLEDVDVDFNRLRGDSITLQPLLLPARWFTRGWTLQELIAAKEIKFFSSSWRYIGTKTSLRALISNITGIDQNVLVNTNFLATISIAKRFSWAASRETTRSEDIAYCLMGIFDVNMPLLYGEGEKAFIRLQEEIMKDSEDESIFAWQWDHADEVESVDSVGFLAASPKNFARSSHVHPYESKLEPYTITNRGIRIQIPIVRGEDDHQHICVIHCRFYKNIQDSIGILLRTKKQFPGRYFRDVSRPLITLAVEQTRHAEVRTIFIHKFGSLISRSPTPIYCHLRKYPKSAGFDFIEAVTANIRMSGVGDCKPGDESGQWDLEERTMPDEAHPTGYYGALHFSVRSMHSSRSEIQVTSFVAILKLPRSGQAGVGLLPLIGFISNENLTLSEILHRVYRAASKQTATMDILNGSVFASIERDTLTGQEIYVLDIEGQVKEKSEKADPSISGKLLIPEICVEEVV